MPEIAPQDPILELLSKDPGQPKFMRMHIDAMKVGGLVRPEDEGETHLVGIQQTTERQYEIQIALQRLHMVARGFRVTIDGEGKDTIDSLESNTPPNEARNILEELRRNIQTLLSVANMEVGGDQVT